MRTHSLIAARQQPLQSKSPSTKLSHVASPRSHTCLPVPTTPPKLSYKCRAKSQARSSRSKLSDCEVSEMDAQKLRSEFLQVLRSRRSGEVPLLVEPAKPVANPLFQEANPASFSEAMNACPKASIPDFKDKLQEENLYLITEAGEQGRLPVLILSMKENCTQKRPAVVFLHSTNKNKEWLRPLLEAYASRGYVAIAIDSRYHGERARNISTYQDALVSAWKSGDTMPFLFDTAWDLIKLADYLIQREDIDPTRVGITGESLGGMHAWFAAAADTRYAVVVPIIGVQGFRWAIDNDKWQARVDSIKRVFEEARIDLRKSVIDKQVVEKVRYILDSQRRIDPGKSDLYIQYFKLEEGVIDCYYEVGRQLTINLSDQVWDRIAPGLASQFDSPYSIPAIAPRPLLILNGAEDPRCPLAGLDVPKSQACEAYADAHAIDNFKFIAQPGIGHEMTPLMVIEASDWFDQFLKQ